jgi:hypothetical protein
VVGDIFIDSKTLLMTDFVNLKIKSTQSFEDIYRDKICVCIHRINAYMCISIYIYIIFLKEKK